MIALIGNFDLTELLVIAVVALMAFGKRLPEVAMRAAVQVARARRALSDMWREAGLEDELRKVRREVEREARLPELQSPYRSAKEAGRRYVRDLERELEARPAPTPRPPAEATRPRGSEGPGRGAAEVRREATGEGDPYPSPPAGSTAGGEVVDLTPRPVKRDPALRDDRREDAGAASQGDPPADPDGDRETA